MKIKMVHLIEKYHTRNWWEGREGYSSLLAQSGKNPITGGDYFRGEKLLPPTTLNQTLSLLSVSKNPLNFHLVNDGCLEDKSDGKKRAVKR